MMKQKSLLVLLFSFLPLLLLPLPVSSNSAEPPSLVVIVAGAPEDVDVNILDEAPKSTPTKKSDFYEDVFIFYRDHTIHHQAAVLHVTGGGEDFTVTVEKDLVRGYETLVTLDFASRTVSPGKLLSRQILLTAIRVISTLLVEGLIFFLFGFRKGRSWLIFLLVNLLTQGALNLWINSLIMWYPAAVYSVFLLFFFELVIILAESLLFILLIKEKKKSLIFGCVLAANIASWVLGGTFILFFPI